MLSMCLTEAFVVWKSHTWRLILLDFCLRQYHLHKACFKFQACYLASLLLQGVNHLLSETLPFGTCFRVHAGICSREIVMLIRGGATDVMSILHCSIFHI